MVDLRIGHRRSCRVLDQKAVLDTPSGASGECTGQPGSTSIGQSCAVRRGRARLGATKKSRPDLGGARPGGQDCGHCCARRDPACGDERKIHPFGQELQKGQQAVVFAILAVDERTAVSSGLDSLRHQDISPGRCGHVRLRRICHRHPDLGSGRVQPGNHWLVRAAEGERHDRDLLGHGQLDLGGEPVVVVPRIAQAHPVPVGLPGDLAQVRRQVDCGDFVVRHEEVEPVRPVTELT